MEKRHVLSDYYPFIFIESYINSNYLSLRMMIEEEDQSMCDALKQVKMVALEDREMQKTRVYLYQGYDDDEEEGW